MKLELRLLLLSNYLNFFGSGLFLPLYAVFVQFIGGNIFHAGASFGTYTLTAGIVTFIFGKLEDKMLDKRKMFCLGYFLVVIGASSYLFITELWHLYLVQVLNAIAFFIFYSSFKTFYS